jgi:hypothetical protein
MYWRFWRRRTRNQHEADADAQASRPDARSSVPLQHSTVKEVLALQQLIGNQTVLRMLAPDTGRRETGAARTLESQQQVNRGSVIRN